MQVEGAPTPAGGRCACLRLGLTIINMPEVEKNRRRKVLIAVSITTLAVTALFVGMIRDFLIALLLAAIFSAMAAPLHVKVSKLVGERTGLAATITIAILLICVLVPALTIVLIAASQASDLIAGIGTLVQRLDTDWSAVDIPNWLPFKDQIEKILPQITAKAGELAAKLASLFISFVSAATLGTANFFLHLFIMLYAMVFFLQQKATVLAQLARLSGLPPETQRKLADSIISVSRATIKGTLVIGIIQGALGGVAFAFVGVEAAAFWGVVMAVASVIPAIGPAIVWIPCAIYLAFTGEIASGIGLAVWGVFVVGLADNLLRPALVGRDAQMSDLMVLVSTFGGLAMFGAAGLVIGPVIAGIFITILGVFDETLEGFSAN